MKPGNPRKIVMTEPSCHSKGHTDYLFWSLLFVLLGCFTVVLLPTTLTDSLSWFKDIAYFTTDFIYRIWWGLLLGFLMIFGLSFAPPHLVQKLLGKDKGLMGILRATLAGVLLDLCSHGILMVAASLYKKGVRNGQMMAFLIASPWNSFTFLIILFSLIGFFWTMAFLIGSMVIAILTGLLFDLLETKEIIPVNPYQHIAQAKHTHSQKGFVETLLTTFKESQSILRWILLGIVLSAIIKTFLHTEMFQQYFGPTLLGLATTIVFATIIEVCSEGTTPIASDLLLRAKAPGNSFAFLMSGVATDYTELLIVRQATQSLKITLLLPLTTLPQIFLLAWLFNNPSLLAKFF